jgi:hypothetical protein
LRLRSMAKDLDPEPRRRSNKQAEPQKLPDRLSF